MLFVPLHRKISGEYFPWITLGLLLVNCLVFFGPQQGDQARFERAHEFYFEQQLDQVEFPLFTDHLRVAGESEQLQLWLELTDPETSGSEFEPRQYALLLLESNHAFQEQLDRGQLLLPVDEQYPAWRAARDGYQQLRGATFIERYQLSFSDPSPVQLLSSMFLHGNLAHLFGNMLFLVLLGLLVEGALRPGIYFGAYLLCGVVAAAASWLVHAGEPHGLVGASGAIAGLMGMYTTLFGRRHVRFFYWILVYFDYVKKPAIYLLPIWLGWELLQLLVVDSNVAYEAHAAGIATGATLGWLLHRQRKVDLQYLDLETRVDRREDGLATARQHLAKLEVAAAKRELSALTEEYPSDPQILSQYFKACAFEPESRALHESAKQLFALTENKPETDHLLIEAFAHYRQLTGGKIKLSAAALAQLARRMARRGEHAPADELVRMLLSKAPQTAGLVDAFDALVAAYQLAGQPQRAEALRKLKMA